MKSKLLGTASVFFMFLLASCAASDIEYPETEIEGELEEMYDVTLTVSTENSIGSTRADYGPGQDNKLGQGLLIDKLIYAVYEDNGGNKFTRLDQYGDFDNPVGQAVIQGSDAAALLSSEGVKIELRLMRGKDYRIAFWAQSSKTDAYDTRNLERVEVRYPGMTDSEGNEIDPEQEYQKKYALEHNGETDPDYPGFSTSVESNDEYRDAFCKVEVLSASDVGNYVRSIVLTRPFAQINAGTTKADEIYMQTKMIPNLNIRQSKIELSGLARFMDVVRDKIDVDHLVGAKFEYEVTPLWLYQTYKNGGIYWNGSGPSLGSTYKDYDFINNDWPYLTIDLNGNGKIDGDYSGRDAAGNDKSFEDFPTIIGSAMPETFNYLSMNYVLVPSIKHSLTSDGSYEFSSTTLPEVRITLSSFPDEIYGRTVGIVHVKNLPVSRNWRTNILGGLSDTDKPRSIVESADITVIKNPHLEGDVVHWEEQKTAESYLKTL